MAEIETPNRKSEFPNANPFGVSWLIPDHIKRTIRRSVREEIGHSFLVESLECELKHHNSKPKERPLASSSMIIVA